LPAVNLFLYKRFGTIQLFTPNIISIPDDELNYKMAIPLPQQRNWWFGRWCNDSIHPELPFLE